MFLLWVEATYKMIQASAPWLLSGFLIAGFIHVIIPSRLIKKHLEHPGLLSVLKASLVGIPLPLCSCSVIPVGIELRRRGASPGATASFLTSTPQIGIDSFILSYFLIGPFLAIARIVAAFASAFIVGILLDHGSTGSQGDQQSVDECCKNCSKDNIGGSWRGFLNMVYQAFSYGFGKLFNDITVVLILGFVLSGLITAIVPENFVSDLSLSPVGATLIMLLVSIPTYVCATASTPIAAALLLKGMFPGAVLAFLLGGAATNMTTILAMRQYFGNKAVAYYVGSIFIVSFLAAITIDYLFVPDSALLINEIHQHCENQGASTILSTVCLLLLLGKGLAFRIYRFVFGSGRFGQT